MRVSLFGSSIRPHLWPAFFRSLWHTTVDVEVIFAGNLPPELAVIANDVSMPSYVEFHYIATGDIKPAQCYAVAFKHCTGDLVCWIADDCEFPDDVIGKACRFYQKECGPKDIVCIKTRENYGEWRVCDETCHHFFANSPEAPKMAPIGMMRRAYFKELGGIDRRYICGQWDNDLSMRIYNDGGKMFYFGDGCIDIDHVGKHDREHGVTFKRPFGQGYAHDRRILEAAWGRKGQMVYRLPYKRLDKGFEPYEDKDLETKSQSFTLEGIFHD